MKRTAAIHKRHLVPLLVWVALFGLLAGAVGFGLLLYGVKAPYKGYDGEEVIVSIAPRTPSAAVFTQLESRGVLRDWRLGMVALKVLHHGKTLKAGEYRFAGPRAPDQVVLSLVAGDVVTYRITVPEGFTAEEVFSLFYSQGFASQRDYEFLFTRPAEFEGVPAGAPTLEGFLFPDTYTVTRSMTAREILSAMTRQFARRLPPDFAEKAKAGNMGVLEATTLASLVEKETALPVERPVVAGVYRNRLNAGMLLQCDPTTIYALKRLGRWRGSPRRARSSRWTSRTTRTCGPACRPARSATPGSRRCGPRSPPPTSTTATSSPPATGRTSSRGTTRSSSGTRPATTTRSAPRARSARRPDLEGSPAGRLRRNARRLMSASASSPRPFGPYVLTRAIGSDPLGEVWRGGTAGAPLLRPFYLFRTFTAASIDRTALHAAMETAVHLVDELKGPAVAKGTVLGVIDDTPFLAVEYVEGRTLDVLLAARVLGAVMPAEHGLLVAERLLTALEAGTAVERYTGAPHGFLVPAFVSVSNEGEARVFGYGLGTGLLPSLGVPRARQAFAPYIAPEVLASAKPSVPGDLYSVGAILFEALTGKPPLPGVALEGIEASTLAVDGSPVPEDIRRLLRRALHPDPATRDRSVANYRRDLSALLYGGPYAPSSFNLAFFLQKNFERAIQREQSEIAAEEALDPAALTAGRPAAESTGRRRPEAGGMAPVPKPETTPPARKLDSTTGSRRIPVAPAPPARPAPAKGTAPVRMMTGPPKKPLGGVPVWAVALGAVVVLGAGAYFALRPSAPAPAPAPTPAPRPTAAPPTPVPTPAPVVVGKDDPLFQAAVQKKLDEELKKQEARAAKQQDSAAKKKQADIDQAAEEARKAREIEDAARTARDRSDREEAARLAREAAAKRREEAQAAAAVPVAPPAKEGDFVDIEACDTPPIATRQVSPLIPPMARQKRISGTVLLRVLVDENGKPAKVEVLRDVTPNVGLGASSVQALGQWRWKPATKNGVKVKTWMAVQVPFKN